MTTPTNDGVQEVVRAKRFELVDDDGAVRGRMEMNGGEPTLSLLNSDGLVAWSVEVSSSGMPRLYFNDENDNLRLIANLEHDGCPALEMLGEDENVRLSVGEDIDGVLRLVMNDQNGNGRIIAFISDDGTPAIELTDKDGKTRRL